MADNHASLRPTPNSKYPERKGRPHGEYWESRELVDRSFSKYNPWLEEDKEYAAAQAAASDQEAKK